MSRTTTLHCDRCRLAFTSGSRIMVYNVEVAPNGHAHDRFRGGDDLAAMDLCERCTEELVTWARWRR